jgi:hypothetical protein
MVFNRWQCWILSLFKDFSGHNFFVEECADRNKEKREGVVFAGYVLHCLRCKKHNLFITDDFDLKVGDFPKEDSFRLPV